MAKDGETTEETLLQESACKEAYYVGRLLELQTEATLSRSVASNAQAENERLSTLVQELREVSCLRGYRVGALSDSEVGNQTDRATKPSSAELRSRHAASRFPLIFGQLRCWIKSPCLQTDTSPLSRDFGGLFEGQDGFGVKFESGLG